MSQHFLTDHDSIRRIVDAAEIKSGDLVIEVGPGKGALTELLLDGPGSLVGIELDTKLCNFLRGRFGNGLKLINEDVLEVDFRSLLPPSFSGRVVLVGNLPYHVSGAIIEKILESRVLLSRAVVMVQREVAHRMTASPGGKDYGILSVAVQLHALPTVLFDLPPASFDPEPRVFSSVVRMDFDASPEFCVRDEQLLFTILRTVFNQRRKMIKNTLTSFFGNNAVACRRALLHAGVDPDDRPETISISQYDALCQHMIDNGDVGGQAN